MQSNQETKQDKSQNIRGENRQGRDSFQEIRREIGRREGFIFDLDGVVWRGEEVIPGCPELIKKLRSLNKRIVFLSNNSSMSRRQMREKLSSFGIEAASAEIYNSAAATAGYIHDKQPEARVLVMGMDGLREEISSMGLELARIPEEADYLVAGYDREISYERMSQALQALLAGAGFIVTNDDGILPTEKGYLPGAGLTVGAIKGMIKREPDVVIGKPNKTIIKMVLESSGLRAEDFIFVGDSLDKDIIMANDCGIYSVLVMSGNTSREKAEQSPIKACLVLPTAAELTRYL